MVGYDLPAQGDTLFLMVTFQAKEKETKRRVMKRIAAFMVE